MIITSKKVSILLLLFLCLPMFISAEMSGQSPISTNKVEAQRISSTTSLINQVSVQLNSAQSESVLNTLPGNGSWQELGPSPIIEGGNYSGWGTPPFSGRVTAIAVNGSNQQEIFVGAAQGGVWKSLDGGNHWIPLMDNQTSLAVGTIALSPDNSTIYVGTGEPNHSGDSYYGSGLLKSTDGGVTWTTLGASYFSNSAISAIVINKSNPLDILVSTTFAVFGNGYSSIENSNGVGIFRSADGGTTWVHTLASGNNVGTYGIASMVANVTNQNTIYAGDFYGSIWKSTDGGINWKIFYSEPSLAYNERVQVAVTPANDSLLYAVLTNSSYDIYTAFTYDTISGTTYTFNPFPIPNQYQYGPCNSQCFYDLVLTVSPVDQNTIYVGTNSLYKTTNLGQTWSFLGGAEWNGNLHPDQHALFISPDNPNVIYSGNDGGIWKSTNAGSTWTNLNTNLGITQFSSIAASPTNDTHLIGGVQDNACDIYTNNTSWKFAAAGDGGASLFINDNTMLCNYDHLDPRISVDSGTAFNDIKAGLNQNDQSAFYAPMTQDPSNPAIIYLGSNNLYRVNLTSSTTWTDISNTSGYLSTGFITSIAVSKSNGNIIYVGDNKGIVQVSTDGGYTWKQILSSSDSITMPALGGQVVPVTSVAVDPFNPNIVMVSFAVQNNADGVVYSTDQGSTWSTTTLTALSGVAVNVIKISPVTDIAFIGTDRGVYYFNGSDTTWYQVGTGLPNAAVFDLAFTASNYLVAATHGRGVWLNYLTPFITLDSLTNNTYVSSGTQVNALITDPNGFSNGAYYWDSNIVSTTNGKINTIIPSGQGPHFLHVSAQDTLGNWRNVTFVIYVDDSVATMTLPVTFTNTTLISGSTIELYLNNSLNIPIDTALANWNGTANTTVVTGGTGTNGNLTLTIPNGNGIIYLHVYIMDAYGKWTAKTFVFTIQPKQTTTSTSTTSSVSSNSSTSTKSKSSPGFETVALLGALGIIFLLRKRNH